MLFCPFQKDTFGSIGVLEQDGFQALPSGRSRLEARPPKQAGSLASETGWKPVLRPHPISTFALVGATYETSVNEVLGALQKEFPRHTCFVTPPGEATRAFGSQLLAVFFATSCAARAQPTHYRKTLVHELKHAGFQGLMGHPYDDLPKWVREGLAVWGSDDVCTLLDDA